MSVCPRSTHCVFYTSVEPNVIKRVRYATSFGYCRGGQYEACALYQSLESGRDVAPGLLPDGSIGDYHDETRVARRFLIIEDAPVFAALASTTITMAFHGAEVVRRATFDDAAKDLAEGTFSAVVCGFGLGGDRTVHDVQKLTTAPIVVLTGRLGHVEAPHGVQVVRKGAGPDALAKALKACVV